MSRPTSLVVWALAPHRPAPAPDALVGVTSVRAEPAQTVTTAAEFDADVVVVDVDATEPDARALCRALRAALPDARVVALTHSDDEAAYATLVAGADALVLDDGTSAGLEAAVTGRLSTITGRAASRLVDDVDQWARRAADPLRPPPTLTATERTVLTALADGATMAGIAEEHSVTVPLVAEHIGYAVAKLQRYVNGADVIRTT